MSSGEACVDCVEDAASNTADNFIDDDGVKIETREVRYFLSLFGLYIFHKYSFPHY